MTLQTSDQGFDKLKQWEDLNALGCR